MKIKINVDTLRDSMAVIQRAVGKPNQGNLLNNVLFNLSSERSSILANNGSFQIRSVIHDLKVDEPAVFLVDFSKLFSIVKTLPADKQITLSLADGKVRASCGKSRSTMSTVPIDKYPMLQIEEELVFFENTDEIRTGFSKVLYAAPQNIAKAKALNGVAFIGDGEKLDICASDTHQVAISSSESLFSGNAIVPYASCMAVRNFLPSASEFSVSTGKMILKSPDFEMITNLLDYKPMGYQSVVPKDSSSHISLTFSKENILDSLSRILIVVEDPKLGYCELVAEAGNTEAVLTGVVRYSSNEVKEAVPINNEGGKITCTFNPKFLLDMLSSIDDETVTVKVYESRGLPIVFKKDGLVLLMSQITV